MRMILETVVRYALQTLTAMLVQVIVPVAIPLMDIKTVVLMPKIMLA